MQMKLEIGLQGPGDKEKLVVLLAQSSVRRTGWKGAPAQEDQGGVPS